MAELTPGLILCNDYELVEPIGKGGMGAIWRAKDLPGNRDVALKFVPRDVQNFESEMDRVEDVFGVIHALQHQNICPLYAMKNSGNELGFFLVMKFIPGLPLGKFARMVRRQTGDFTVAQLVSVLRPIASALDYAHTRRPPVIHRDIKPANIMVMADDDLRVLDVQLIDFGLAATFRASLTRVSQVKLNTSGTRPYMAPEQWDGAYQNAATDQYALGITAYELLSGRFPFESDDYTILKDCVKTAPVPPIETLSNAQNAVLRRALAKTRDERFPTCAAFIEALASAPADDFNSIDEEPTFCDSIPPTPTKSFLERLAEAERQAEEAKRREAENKLRQNLDALEEKIGEEYQSGSYAEAVTHLNELLQLKPDNANAQWLLEKATKKLEIQRKEEAEQKEREHITKEEVERKAREETERQEQVIKTLIEAERKERERQAQEEAERLKRELQARAESEQLERERKAREETERLKREFEAQWLERERKASEEAERKPREERERRAREKATRKPGARGILRVDGIEYAFRWCPPGEFMMGSPENEPGRFDDEKQHKVKLTQGFWMMETPVTKQMWRSVMGENPRSWCKGDQEPINCVSWDDCQSFCKKLSQKLGQQVQLPTEAQWEYACRAGTMGAYAGDLDSMTWYHNNHSDSTSYVVRRKKPNAWGLYDMHGNVWEWCSDYYDEKYYERSPTCDPENTTASSRRVRRGGSRFEYAVYCRSAYRYGNEPEYCNLDVGLRVILVSD